MTIGRILIHVVLLVAVSPAALSDVSVRSMNYPAWVERGELRVPVAPGDQLQVGDVVHTGDSGGVWLQVKGGNVIKLGQAARLAIEQTGYRGEGDDAVFVAAFNLLHGAFHFTSRFFILQPSAKHELDFKIGAVTVELDSSDVYAHAAGGEDSVILIEGRIEITSPGHTATIMDTPLTRYRKAETDSVGQVDRIDRAMAENLGADTELDSSLGIAKVTGLKVLVLRSLSNPARVEAEITRLQQAGYAARARIVELDGVSYTRIQLEGLAHLVAAANLRHSMIEAGLIEDAWIDVKE